MRTLGELRREALKVGGRDMFTLCVRELRFNEVLLSVEELCELVADAGPEDAGEGAPTGGAIETKDPPPKLTPALADEMD